MILYRHLHDDRPTSGWASQAVTSRNSQWVGEYIRGPLWTRLIDSSDRRVENRPTRVETSLSSVSEDTHLQHFLSGDCIEERNELPTYPVVYLFIIRRVQYRPTGPTHRLPELISCFSLSLPVPVHHIILKALRT